MSHKAARTSKRVRMVLFFFGIAISLSAWFIDKAPFFPAIERLIASDAVAAREAMQILDGGKDAVLPVDHPGADVLLRWW